MGSREGARKAAEARAAARRAPIETEAARIKVVAAGVDTLELHTQAPLRGAMVRQLEILKEQAAATLPGKPLPTWQAAGLVFEVKRGGSKRGAFLLESDAMAISLNPSAPKGLPSGMAEIRSRHLWQDVDDAAADAEEVLSVLTVGEHPDVQVSRVDVTVDWQGWEPEASLLDRFVCRARKDASYRAHRRHTGWSWGSGGAIYARCYDKTVEIAHTEKSEWFPEVWTRSGCFDASLPVWRAEFQVRRDAIRELAPIGLDPGMLKNWEGTRGHLGSIFGSMSEHWLSLRLPRTGKTRQKLDPRWEQLRELAAARFVTTGSDHPVDLARVQAETEFKRTVQQLAGYVARGIAERWALRGNDNEEVAVTYERLFADVCDHFIARGGSLEARARALFEPMRVAALAAKARRKERDRARDDHRALSADDARRLVWH